MTDINYGALQTGGGDAPADGTYTAYLAQAKLRDISGGRLITEWQASDYYWESWNRFDVSGMRWTQELLDGLGVDRSKLTDDDAFQAELERVQGHEYIVRVETRMGSQGDRTFTSTYVQALASPAAQQQLSDAPADVEGLPEAVGVAVSTAVPEDDDIPF